MHCEGDGEQSGVQLNGISSVKTKKSREVDLENSDKYISKTQTNTFPKLTQIHFQNSEKYIQNTQIIKKIHCSVNEKFCAEIELNFLDEPTVLNILPR